MSAILFLKAAIPGGAANDLFPGMAQVKGHVRGGTFVQPYVAMRRRRPGELAYPDEAHRHLHDVGKRHLAGEQIPKPEVMRLWHHFRGFAEDDPDTGFPFNKPEHVLDAAADYAMDIQENNYAGSYVSPDKAEDYWRRATSQAEQRMREAFGIRAA